MKYFITILFSLAIGFQACSDNEPADTVPQKVIVRKTQLPVFKNLNDFTKQYAKYWNNLSPEAYDKTALYADLAARQRLIRKKTAEILVFLHKTLTKYKIFKLHTGKSKSKRDFLGGEFYGTREIILKYLNVMQTEGLNSFVDKNSAIKIIYKLAEETERLLTVKNFEKRDIYHKRKLLVELSGKKLQPSDSVISAANIIANMQMDKSEIFPVNQRIKMMKTGVETALSKEISSPLTDWGNTEISENFLGAMKTRGFRLSGIKPSKNNKNLDCSKRKDALNRLAKLIKQGKPVKNGIIMTDDLSVNPEVAAYQKNTANVINILFANNEISADSVFEISKALDLELRKPKGHIFYLKYNTDYYLRALLKHKISGQILKFLSIRGEIPETQNLRGSFNCIHLPQTDDASDVSDVSDVSTPTEDSTSIENRKIETERKNRILFENFKKLYLDGTKIKFPEDKLLVIHRYMLPFENLTYRMKLRRLARILIKLNIADYFDLKYFELVTGIRLLGVIKN